MSAVASSQYASMYPESRCTAAEPRAFWLLHGLVFTTVYTLGGSAAWSAASWSLGDSVVVLTGDLDWDC